MKRRSFLKLLGLTVTALAAGIPLGQEVRGAYMQLLCEGEVVAELPTDFRLNARMTAELEVLQPTSVDQMKLYPAGWTKPISVQKIVPLHSQLGDTFNIAWDIKAPEGCGIDRLRPQYHTAMKERATLPRFCIDDLGEDKVKARYDEMLAGDNRQPCKVCAKRVKAEFCFCHVCGEVLCDVHFSEHLTSDVPLGKLEKA